MNHWVLLYTLRAGPPECYACSDPAPGQKRGTLDLREALWFETREDAAAGALAFVQRYSVPGARVCWRPAERALPAPETFEVA